ncbi:MAG: hypothetical protein HRF43_10860 [Phycisphaerae bacterium]
MRSRPLTLSMAAALLVPAVAWSATRGGWPDLEWTYLFEGDADVAGPLGAFTSLEGTWDRNNPFNDWQGDGLSDAAYPGGVETFVRAGLGDNELGVAVADARTLGILDLGEGQQNRMIYFERFLTSGNNTGAGAPLIDFQRELTAICRFRFFSIDDLNASESLRRGLGIKVDDDPAIAAAGTANAGRNEYEEGPRESEGSPRGMFMITRGDVFTALGGAAGGLYWGVGVDGDDSWDPSTFTAPPPPAAPVGVKVAFIVRGPHNANATFQMSDARIVDRLRARGISVTVLDNGAGTPLAGGHISYVSTSNPALKGPAAVANDHDLVIISSTVGSANVGAPNSYHPYNVPLIMWENGLGNPARGYGIADQGGLVLDATSLRVVNNTHPITAGLPLGVVPLVAGSVARRFSYIGFGLPPCAVQLAHHPDNPGVSGLVVYDPTVGGGQLWVSPVLQSNQRWVFLPLEDDTFWALNQAGMQIFDGAVEWALGPAKAALLGPRPPLPPPPPEPAAWKPSFYLNLGATPVIPAAGQALATRVLAGRFFRDLTSPDPAVPLIGGDTRVWADLPTGSTNDFLSVKITTSPEPAVPAGPLPAVRVKVFFNGSDVPAIEVQNHHLDPSIVSAVGNGSANDGTGLGMGLWRIRSSGYLDVDYFGVRDPASPPAPCRVFSQDVDWDGDVDDQDLVAFLECSNGPAIPHPSVLVNPACKCLDVDRDGDVDHADFGEWQRCFNGSNRQPGCTQ